MRASDRRVTQVLLIDQYAMSWRCYNLLANGSVISCLRELNTTVMVILFKNGHTELTILVWPIGHSGDIESFRYEWAFRTELQ